MHCPRRRNRVLFLLAALALTAALLCLPRLEAQEEEASEEEKAPPAVTNSLNMEMVTLPGGVFTMGGRMTAREVADLYEAEHPEWFEDEHPAHQVRVGPFSIGRYEVTMAQRVKPWSTKSW